MAQAMHSDLSDLFLSRLTGSRQVRANVTQSTAQMISLLSQGVEGAVLREMSHHIPKIVLSSTVGTDASNLSKLYRRKRLSQKQTEELNDLTALWDELRTFFDGDTDLMDEWMTTPLPILEGQKVEDLMSSAYGRKRIREVIGEMAYGEMA